MIKYSANTFFVCKWHPEYIVTGNVYIKFETGKILVITDFSAVYVEEI